MAMHGDIAASGCGCPLCSSVVLARGARLDLSSCCGSWLGRERRSTCRPTLLARILSSRVLTCLKRGRNLWRPDEPTRNDAYQRKNEQNRRTRAPRVLTNRGESTDEELYSGEGVPPTSIGSDPQPNTRDTSAPPWPPCRAPHIDPIHLSTYLKELNNELPRCGRPADKARAFYGHPGGLLAIEIGGENGSMKTFGIGRAFRTVASIMVKKGLCQPTGGEPQPSG